MSDINELKFSKKSLIFIFSTLGVAIIVALLIQFFPYTEEQGEDFDSLFTAIGLSCFGFLFIGLRKKKIQNYWLEPFELLLLLVYPAIALIPLLKDPLINLVLFIPIWFGLIIVWLLIVTEYIVKPIDNSQHHLAVRRLTLFTWGGLMSLSLPVFVMLIGFILPYVAGKFD